MVETAPMQRDVNIHFTESDHRGTVLCREGRMILDFSDREGGRYLIVGNPVEHHFEGRNEAMGGSQVTARWADIGGGVHCGLWYEGGFRYVFRIEFETPA